MMGTTHALSGVAAGLVAAPLVGVHSLAGTVVFAVVTAGYALLPDLDHDSSSVSRILGPVTDVLSVGVRAVSRAVYHVTKGPVDAEEDHDGGHRGLTHTLLFAAGVGWLAAWGGHLSPWVVFGVVVFGVLLAEDRLGDWVLPVVAVAGLVWWGTQPNSGHVLSALTELAGPVGWAVAIGCVTHDLGDMLTEHGAPLFAPIPIPSRGSFETWYEVRPPGWLRFRTGGRGETVVMLALLGVIGWFGCQLATQHLPTTPNAGSSPAREGVITSTQ